PDVFADLRRRDVLAALADDDGDFALVIEVRHTLGKRDRVVRPRDFRGDFPEAPLAGLSGFLGDLLDGHVGFAEAVGPHAGQVRGVVAADAGDAPLRPGRVDFRRGGVVNDFLIWCGA